MSKVKIEHLDDAQIRNLGINSWPIWEKEKSRFDWTYSDTEHCFILEGEFSVETDEGTFNVAPGDYVTFAKGLSCIWDIKKPVKKHYKFT